MPIQHEEESSGDSESQCYMVQGNDSLEVNSETQLDNDDCSSCDENIDAHALNEELSIVYEKLIEKYNVLKKKSLGVTPRSRNTYLVAYSDFSIVFFDLLLVFVLYYESFI